MVDAQNAQFDYQMQPNANRRKGSDRTAKPLFGSSNLPGASVFLRYLSVARELVVSAVLALAVADNSLHVGVLALTAT